MPEGRAPRIWIIEIGEPLPLPGASIRLMRAGQIAEQLRRRGADVVWWASDFEHLRKAPFDLAGKLDHQNSLRLENGVTLRFLHGRPYGRNVSLARIRNGREVAADFVRQANAAPEKPDAILCFYPTIELARASADFGKAHDVPVFIDVRDLWPDAFLDVSPAPRALTKLMLAPMYRAARAALAGATGLSSISPPMLDWALEKAGRRAGPDDAVIPLAYTRVPLSPDALRTEEDAWRARGVRLDGTERIFCFFGGVTRTPELDTLVGAIRALDPATRQNLKVVICGLGDRVEWLRQQRRDCPELIVPGQVGAGAIGALMAHATAGLLIYPRRPDLMSSYPNKVGEYLSASLPILSTLGGLAGELITRHGCGIVTPSEDAKALSRSMVSLIRDPNLQKQMSRRAAELFASRFDAEFVYGNFADRLMEAAHTAKSSV